MRGSLGIITFADDGTVAETVLLSPATGNRAADIPHGVYHTAVSLETGTVFYEAKAGPYLPLTDDEKARWAPDDGTPAAQVNGGVIDTMRDVCRPVAGGRRQEHDCGDCAGVVKGDYPQRTIE